MGKKIPIQTKNPLFGLYLYPEAKSIMELQQKVTWTAVEIPIEDDKQDYLVNMSPEQYYLSTVTLQTFVEIEQSVGDIWYQIGTWFPHSEIEGACSVVSAMEKGVHSFFYQKMSDVLNIDPKEINRLQNELGPIKDKLDFLKSIFKNPEDDKPLSLAVVTIVEQVLLFGNFAMLKSFNANGNNMITNTLFGVDYVVNDENIHGNLATFLFKTYLDESEPNELEMHLLLENISSILNEVVIHGEAVINLVFKDTDKINGITAIDLVEFVRHRANMVIDNLSIDIPTYIIGNNPISGWFYKNVNALKMHDFFVGGSTQYRKDWSETKFTRFKKVERC